MSTDRAGNIMLKGPEEDRKRVNLWNGHKVKDPGTLEKDILG